MVIFRVVVVAHWPVAGVKVKRKVPVTVVLMVAGLHVPVIAGVLVELNGSNGAMLFWQSGPIGANIGTISLVMMMSSVFTIEHWPESGVKV